MTDGDFPHVKMDWNNPDKAQAMRLFKQQVEMVIRKTKLIEAQDKVDEILPTVGI